MVTEPRLQDSLLPGDAVEVCPHAAQQRLL